ncbi:MAG: AraC family transcriptional regulator [Archangium sp.]|nr:AraC family transcriptional regulator [Archangium sp.]
MTAPLRPAESLAAFQRAPEGTYLSGEHFLFLCETEELYAFFIWGQACLEETHEVVKVLATELRPGAVPHRSYVDFSGMTGIDRKSFGVLRDFLEASKPRQAEVTVQEAIIRPGGFAGTVVAGYFAIYEQPFPTRLFTDSAEAAGWLELDPALLKRWETLRDEVRGVPPELKQLRRLLRAQLDRADLPSAARQLGVSTRTLQRRLGSFGTTFQRVLDGERLELAQELVAESEEKLSSIATQVGFASYQHFSDWFRRKAGSTAEAFRRRER